MKEIGFGWTDSQYDLRRIIIVQPQLIQLLCSLVTKNFEPKNIRAITRVREGLPL
jgi:hypothetical protein